MDRSPRCAARRVALALAACLLLQLLPLAAADDPFPTPTDQSPAKGNSPCPGKIPNDIYDYIKDRFADVVGAQAGVVADINAQVKGEIPDADEKAVTVEFHIVNKTQFVAKFLEDFGEPGDTPAKTRERREEAESIYDGNAAYTTLGRQTSANGVQKVRIYLFCIDENRIDAMNLQTKDGFKLLETLVHELVHAKLYAMLALGKEQENLPFQDHDKRFYEEIKKLLDLLKKNLKLAYAPQRSGESGVLAHATFFDPETGTLAFEAVLTGRIAYTAGPAQDADTDLRTDVAFHVTALDLASADGAFHVSSPANTSTGRVEEQAPGVPFPADASLTLGLDARTPWGNLTQSTPLAALVTRWPPFAVATDPLNNTFVNPLPSPPFDVRSLRFLPPDADVDGKPDPDDPDDDSDGIPDAEDPADTQTDRDGDGFPDGLDNCPDLFNPDQADTDRAGQGDACDSDDDNDGRPDEEDAAIGGEVSNERRGRAWAWLLPALLLAALVLWTVAVSLRRRP